MQWVEVEHVAELVNLSTVGEQLKSSLFLEMSLSVMSYGIDGRMLAVSCLEPESIVY
jgi:hypothetical protein